MKSTKGNILVFFSLFVFFYWTIGNSTNVYEHAILGAIYEILWIFMLASFIVIPILCAIFLIKEGFSWKSPYIFALLINVLTNSE